METREDNIDIELATGTIEVLKELINKIAAKECYMTTTFEDQFNQFANKLG